MIVFQATNRFVDIAPVVERLAAEFGLTAVLVSDQPDDNADNARLLDFEHRPDHRHAQHGAAATPSRSARSRAAPAASGFRVWTDDFYNMLHILKH